MVRARPASNPPMAKPHSVSIRHIRALRFWLFCVAGMIVLTLVVGGATRLTESGLSITEWKPVTGVFPPWSDAAWTDEFKAYQAIPQYQQLNRGMSLGQFKVIYWWEWTHRFLARTTGAVFLLPFLYFLWRGWVPRGLRLRLWSIFAGGALLGFVGWWMVSSGLEGSGRVSVSQYRLAFHLTLACAIYAAVLWTAQQLRPRPPGDEPARLRVGALAIAVLVLAQIYLGALVAGLDAGLVFNTWPLIDGGLIPESSRLWFLQPAWRNIFENTLTAQFDHRMTAYALWLLAVVHAGDARNRGRAAGALVLAGAVTIQALIGIVTLLYKAPLPLALLHQLVGILVLTIAVLHAERLWPRYTIAPVESLRGAKA